MVHESLDETLRPFVEVSALVLAAGALTLLALALGAELLRRHRRAPALLRVLDPLVPRPARAAALALVTVVATVLGPTTGPATAGADDSVRAWLRGRQTVSTTTTTTTTASGATSLDSARQDPTVVAPPRPGASSRPLVPAPATPPAAPTVHPVDRYVVEPGDCLWTIARRQLGPAATNAAVDAGWRAVYAANREAVGDDPNLIHPGLVLTLPPTTPPQTTPPT